MSVLGAAVNEDQFGRPLAPAQSTQLAQSVNRDEEALDVGLRDREAPLVHVFAKEPELVVVHVRHNYAS